MSDVSPWEHKSKFREKVALKDVKPEHGYDFDWTCPYCNTRNGASDSWDCTSNDIATHWCRECDKETEFSVSYTPYYEPIMPPGWTPDATNLQGEATDGEQESDSAG